MIMIALIDSAFSFFQNYPCRLTHVEMDCDLPCEESVFNSVHPFSEPNFRFCRNLTVSEAFQSLFEEYQEDSLRPPSPSFPQKNIGNPLRFTVFDMFLLIHRMYPFLDKSSQSLINPSSLCLHKHPHDPPNPHPTKVPSFKVTQHNSRWLHPGSNPHSPIAMAQPLGGIT